MCFLERRTERRNEKGINYNERFRRHDDSKSDKSIRIENRKGEVELEMKARWIGLAWLFCVLFWSMLISAAFAKNNTVTYKIGTVDAGEQIFFRLHPDDPNHRSDRIFIGSDSKKFIVIEVQYHVTLRDIFTYWLTDEPLADFNGDDIVNFKDFAIWAGSQ